jgi:hypothetical protein
VSHKSSVSSVNIIDAVALFGVIRVLEAKRPKVDYAQLVEHLEKVRADFELPPAQVSYALAAVDRESEAQAKFLSALRERGIECEPIDFRDAFVSDPLQRPWDGETRSIQSMAARISTLVGYLAARDDADVCIVSGAYDLQPALQFFVHRGHPGRAALVFFRRYLDPRWVSRGLLESPSGGIRFADLEPYAPQILGVDLGVRERQEEPELGGGLFA